LNDKNYSNSLEAGPLNVGNEATIDYKMQHGSYYVSIGACDFTDNCNDSGLFEFK